MHSHGHVPLKVTLLITTHHMTVRSCDPESVQYACTTKTVTKAQLPGRADNMMKETPKNGSGAHLFHMIASNLVRQLTLASDRYPVRTQITGWGCLNAITGLNGSRKSKILDAICFVLGPTNMSSMHAPHHLCLVCAFSIPCALSIADDPLP